MSTQKPIQKQSAQWNLRSWIDESKINESGRFTEYAGFIGQPIRIFNPEYFVFRNPHPSAVKLILHRIKQFVNLDIDDDYNSLFETYGIDLEVCCNPNARLIVEHLINVKGIKRHRYIDFIHWGALSRNESAIELLEQKIIDEMKPRRERKFRSERYHKGMESIDCKSAVHWGELSANPAAIRLLERYPDKIDWANLSANPGPGVVELLERHLEKIDWANLSSNPGPGVVELLERHLEKIDWGRLSVNPGPGVVGLLERYLDKIEWISLSSNPGPGVVGLLERYLDKIIWDNLSLNPGPGVVGLLERYPDKIRWQNLSSNPGPGVVGFLERHLDKIDWANLSSNPGPGVVGLLEKYASSMRQKYKYINDHPEALSLLERYPELIKWDVLSSNPSIFIDDLDYDAMKSAFQPMAKEIIERVWHPSRMEKWPEPAFDEDETTE